jgi:hypothetical protein
MSHMTGIENNKQVLKKVEILVSFYLFFSHTANIYRDTGKDDNVILFTNLCFCHERVRESLFGLDWFGGFKTYY